MKEVRDFELLEKIKEKAKLGAKAIKQKLSESQENTLKYEGALVQRKQLEELVGVLQHVVDAKEETEVKQILREDTIPLELVITSEFWQEFQKMTDRILG